MSGRSSSRFLLPTFSCMSIIIKSNDICKESYRKIQLKRPENDRILIVRLTNPIHMYTCAHASTCLITSV